jgi:hypothetical protein
MPSMAAARGLKLNENKGLSEAYAMTAAQEVLNAITMVLPTAVLVFNTYKSRNRLVAMLLLGSCMHLPISFTYHLGTALRCYPDRIDNDMRRLDQSMQHVVGTIFSYALSGSWKFAILNMIINSFSIRKLWDARTSNDGKRWIPVMVCVLMYTMPMLWRGDIRNYSLAVGSMMMGGMSFVPQLNKRIFLGWGHAVFHTVLTVCAQALADSASNIL